MQKGTTHKESTKAKLSKPNEGKSEFKNQRFAGICCTDTEKKEFENKTKKHGKIHGNKKSRTAFIIAALKNYNP